MSAALLVSSCGTTLPIWETPIKVQAPQHDGAAAQIRSPVQSIENGGIIDEIRALVEIGTPSSLVGGLELIRQRNLGGTEFGRMMNMVITTLLQKVYPHIIIPFPLLDPPQNHIYTRILQNTGEGIYTPPQQNSQDYLEYVLPFLIFIPETKTENPLIALADLRQAQKLNPNSVLAPYFIGLIYERTNKLTIAKTIYNRVYTLSPECYPVVLGLVRIMNAEGQKEEAIQRLQELLIQFPDSMVIKQQLALAYYHNRDWPKAASAISEVLKGNTQNPEFILMQAHALVEEGKLFQAVPFLDRYAGIDPHNRLYLFLRAKIQAEGYYNREAALTYLHTLLNTSSADEEQTLYTARLLLESHREQDQTEGRELLQGLLNTKKPGLMVLDTAFQDALRREAWGEAKQYLNRLLEERPLSEYLLGAYKVEQGLGNTAAALSFARQIHQQDPSNEEGTLAYTSALIDIGARPEAQRIIESRLASLGGGTLKARYYYLRSRIRGDQELSLRDLRECLFEDPRNIPALIALFEIYHRRKDERRAVYYLKQALSFDMDNPQLRRYEQEYPQKDESELQGGKGNQG